MNKKGFTLTELLAVIVILAIISLIATTGVTAVMNSVKTKMLDTKEKEIVQGAILYGQDHKKDLTDTCTIDGVTYTGKCIVKTVGYLIENSYLTTKDTCLIDNVSTLCFKNNLNDKPMNNASVSIYINNNRVYAKITDSTSYKD